jgi:SIR2-like domain
MTLTDPQWKRLLRQIADQNCTPFLGAETSSGALPTASSIAQDWARKSWVNDFRFPFRDEENLPAVAQVIATMVDAMEPREEMRRLLRQKLAPDPSFSASSDVHGILADLPFPLYITTAYDDFLVKALTSRARDVRQDWCRWKESDKLDGSDPETLPFFRDDDYSPTPANPLVYHLFGHVGNNKATESLVLSEDDYLDFLVQTSIDLNRPATSPDKRVPPRIHQAFRSFLLFIGYQPNGMDFRVLLQSISSFLRAGERRHVSIQVIAKGNAIIDAHLNHAINYFEHRYHKLAIEMCWMSTSAFAAELKQRWDALPADQRLRRSI